MRIQYLTMVSAAALLASCTQQDPAMLVSGLLQRPMTVMPTPAAPHAVPTKADPEKVTAFKKPTIAEEKLARISPAAGEAPVRSIQTPVVVPVAKLAEPEPTMVAHKVMAADTGYKLARKYNTTIERILQDNGLKSVTDIREGQQLKIAQNSKPQTSAWDDMKRMLNEPVQPQTTVAQTHTETMAVQSPALAIGQKPQLIMPAESKLATIEPAAGERPKVDEVSYEIHTVEPKETIYRISLKYNVSVLDIMAANDFAEPQDLKSDTKIKVPVKKTITQQLAAKALNADVAPAAGTETPVLVEAVGKPVQVAMLPVAPAGAHEAQQEDMETKAIRQQALKDAAMPVAKDKPIEMDVAKLAEEKRGQVDQTAARTKGLVWPVKGQIVRRFGDDGSGVARTGINIAVPKGTSVLASEGGTVLYADDGLKIYGKMVLLRHDNGMVSAYAHNSYLLVKKNERVKKGQIIALSGSSGNVESPQLHFELRQHASAVDPVAMLPRL